MGKTKKRLSFILVGSAACTITFAPAIGQQATPLLPTGQLAQPGLPPGGSGLSVTLDYLSTFRYDDNLGLDNPSLGSTTRWQNSFALGVINETPDSLLTFDLSGLHRFSDEPTVGSGSSFDEPNLSLGYTKNSANSLFSGNARYRETDLTFNQALTDINQDGVIDAADIVVDTGTRVRSSAGLNWQTGINDPLGLTFNYNHFKNEFRDTNDPSLFDNQTNNYSATASLWLSQVLQSNIRLAHTDFTAQDTPQTDRQTTTLTTGVTYDISPVTTIRANVGATRIDETLRATSVNTVDESFVANFAWVRALTNGTIDAQVDQTFGINGDRINAMAGRSLSLPNGSLAFNIGLTHGPFGEVTPIGDIRYTHTLSSSQITATLRRQVGTSVQSTETRATLASLNYDYFINSISSASFSVNYVEQADEGTGPTNRRKRTNLNASYTRAITSDWNATVGYVYRIEDTAGAGRADGNSVFMSLGRQFVLRP